MSKLLRELRSYDNLEENIPRYALATAVDVKLYTVARYGLNLINIAEYLDEMDVHKYAVSLLDEVKSIFKDYNDDENPAFSDYINRINVLRQKNRDIVSDNTNYTIVFSMYQHILNRVEGRFVDLFDLAHNPDEEVASDILNACAKASKDGYANSLISRIIGELPTRLTKEKFTEYVRNGLSLYRDVDKNTFDDFISMLRYNSLLSKNKAGIKAYDDFIKELEEVDYKNITEEKYNELNERISSISDEIDNLVTFHIILQQLINDLYLMFICDEIGSEELLKLYGQEYGDDISKLLSLEKNLDNEDKFIESAEGVQEEYYEKAIRLLNIYDDGVLKEAYEKVDSIESDLGVVSDSKKLSELLRNITMLLSNSDFVELEEKEAEDMPEGYFEKESEVLISDMIEGFSGMKRQLKRAVMAGVLASLPVFFGGVEELKSYILLSLENCSDDAEKAGSLSLIYDIISEY